MGEHTRVVLEKIEEIANSEFIKDDDPSQFVETLKNPQLMWSFSKRLLAFYNDVLNSQFTADEAAENFRIRAKQKDIALDKDTISRNTIKNWFLGEAPPRHDNESRRRMFVVAFVLGLNKVQTERLFHKVYFDTPFIVRDPRESIYLYCINNGKAFSDAERLIGQLPLTDETGTPDEHTVQTQFLADDIDTFTDERELLNLIKTHPHNFHLRNIAAKQKRQDLLDKLTGREDKEDGLAKQEAVFRYNKERLTEIFKNYSMHSVSFVLDIIKEKNYAGEKGNEETQHLHKVFTQPELCVLFPNEKTLANKNPSTYALRRDIIFLYFYFFWVKALLTKKNFAGEGYKIFWAEIDDVLYSCGLSPLYIKNPYDCLFLYCSYHYDDVGFTPLEVFRCIMAPDDSHEDERGTW